MVLKRLFCVLLTVVFIFDMALYVLFSNSLTTSMMKFDGGESRVAFYEICSDANSSGENGNGSEKAAIYREKESLLISFLEKNFFGEDGEVYSNLKTIGGDLSTLSESVGLVMNYSVLSGRKALFDKEFTFLNDKLLDDGRFVRWRAGTRKAFCNASIDDLRILRALMDAYDEWKNEDYIRTADTIQKSIYERQVSDGYIGEFYDWKADRGKNSTPVCYVDLYTLYKLESFDKNWGEVEGKGLKLVKNSNISKASPLFNKHYDYSTGKYSKDEEFDKSGDICITYSIITALHLAEVNEDTASFTNWLKTETGKGKLYAWYNPITLKPVRQIESTAVYALGAVYAKKVGENALCEMLIDRMLNFMVTDSESSYYGGFGNPVTGEFYSFDNLTALWALALAAH